MGKCILCKKRMGKGEGPFFRVPQDQRKRNNWNNACGVELTSNNWVCGDHFMESDLIVGAHRTKLMPKAVPSLNISSSGGFDTECMEQDPLMCLDTGVDMKYIPEISMHVNSSSGTAEPRVIYNSSETQTDSILLECTMGMELADLKSQNRKLRKENEKLQTELLKSSNLMSSLRSIFTEGQVRKMIMNDKNVQWSLSDISNAICLHASGPRAYRHLYEKGFPIPHETTLRRWYPKFHMHEGILTIALDLMRNIYYLSAEEKVCILAFDEMKVIHLKVNESEPTKDSARKTANYVQVVMARGLWNSWKQPVFYDFDCKISVEILNSIIMAVQNAGFPVVAIVCDMDPSNQKLWRNLGLSIEQPWFPNPMRLGSDKVFAFADAPNLLKLIRNHFFDTGLIWKDETITTRAIGDVMKHTSTSNASIAFKLTDEHLCAKPIGRQKVNLAVQLFSNTTANALRRCSALGLDVEKPAETADLVKLVNDWYDVVSSGENTHNQPGKEPFGRNLQHQKDILKHMNQFISEVIIPGKTNVQPFQKGVLLTNNALPMFYEYLETKYNFKYIMTRRLNQDVLEQLFNNIRIKGGHNDNPTPKEFKFRLREYILSKTNENFQSSVKQEQDSNECLHTANTPSRGSSSIKAGPSTTNESRGVHPEVVDALSAENIDSDLGILQDDGLDDIPGYIVQNQRNNEGEDINDLSFSWMNEVL